MNSEVGERPEVVVLGCGAVGLPLAVALASRGARVLGVDTDAGLVAALRCGRAQLVEDGLQAAVGDGLATGALAFATELRPTERPRAFVICVPTPASRERFDAGPLDGAAEAVVGAAHPGDLVCIRSTVPIGATRRLAERHADRGLAWASCPDRSLAGATLAEQFSTPHLVGGATPGAATRAAALFERLGRVIAVRDPETAEAIKLFANVSRDVSFALANTFAHICEASGVSYAEVRAAGADGYPRFNLAAAGPVGGPCLTKDVHVLAASAPLAGVDLSLLTAARAANERLVDAVAAELLAGQSDAPGPIAILGLGFKGAPATRDQRFAFGPQLVRALAAARPGLEIRTWDPVTQPAASSRDAAIAGAAAIVLANNHPDLVGAARASRALAAEALIVDMCGVLPAAASSGRVRRFGEGAQA